MLIYSGFFFINLVYINYSMLRRSRLYNEYLIMAESYAWSYYIYLFMFILC